MDNIEEVNCIFQQPWWLEAVAPGQWDVAQVTENNRTIARMPYLYQKKMGLKISMMPPFTQVLGPWIEPLEGKYVTRLSRQKSIIQDLIQQLPEADYFKQNFHYTITNWLPFHWAGYEQTTRYTYILENIEDDEAIWSGLKGSIRREIKKAREQLVVEEDLGLKKLWKLHRKTFKRQDKEPNYSYSTFKRLDKACKRRNSRKSFFAIDEQNCCHAAIYLVWDSNSAYYLIGGADPKLRNSGASSLLMWQAINWVSEYTSTFDFEGSMIESIERFFRGFGGRQRRYFRIYKTSKRMQLLMNLRDSFNTLIQ